MPNYLHTKAVEHRFRDYFASGIKTSRIAFKSESDLPAALEKMFSNSMIRARSFWPPKLAAKLAAAAHCSHKADKTLNEASMTSKFEVSASISRASHSEQADTIASITFCNSSTSISTRKMLAKAEAGTPASHFTFSTALARARSSLATSWPLRGCPLLRMTPAGTGLTAASRPGVAWEALRKFGIPRSSSDLPSPLPLLGAVTILDAGRRRKVNTGAGS
mmetsp:Transcript_97452/g.297793  ORF Transcript_97452/g.297793 Transcript_97452/m.297793 type:complete len:220 (-) Transcript_97452:9-668(-)